MSARRAIRRKAPTRSGADRYPPAHYLTADGTALVGIEPHGTAALAWLRSRHPEIDPIAAAFPMTLSWWDAAAPPPFSVVIDRLCACETP